jgi:hypothetical protein
MTEKFAGLTRLGRKSNALAERARSGVSKGGFPRISLNNRGFTATHGDVTKHVGEINPDTGTQCLDCIILDVAPYSGTAKVYFVDPYKEGSNQEPDCSSDDGIRPNRGLNKQAPSCAACIMNTWGSSTTGSGKGKACADKKWLAVIIPQHFPADVVFRLDVPAGSTGRFADYVEAVAGMTLDGQPTDMAELVTKITWDAEKQGRLLFDAVSTVDHIVSIEEISALLQSGDVDKVLRQGDAPALPAPEEAKQIEAPKAAVRPVGAVQTKPAAVTAAKAAPAPVQAAPKPRSPDFKTRVAGMNSAREATQQAAEAVKAAPKAAALVRKPGPLSKKPTAEDVPVSDKFGMAKPATPGAALSSALSMLDLGDDQ